jgi:hypothetical protein
MSIHPFGQIAGTSSFTFSPALRRRDLLLAPMSHESIVPTSAGHEDPFVAPPARGPAEPKGASACEVGRAPLMRFLTTPSAHPGRDAICSPEDGHAFEIIPLRRSLTPGPAPLADLSAGAVRPCGFPLAHADSRHCFTRCTQTRSFSLERQAMRCCSMWGTTCWTSDRFRRAA